MEFDLTETQRAFIVAELINVACDKDISDDDYSMIVTFAELLEHCGEVGTTLHVN
jgi:hypothetical protein